MEKGSEVVFPATYPSLPPESDHVAGSPPARASEGSDDSPARTTQRACRQR